MTSQQQQQQYPTTTSSDSAGAREVTLTRTSNNTSLAHTKGLSYGHSFSESETDVSTSTENLSPEERYALAHTQRQEPQGQENVGNTTGTMASSHFTQSSDLATSMGLSMSTARTSECNASVSSSTNTLIIHNSVSDEPWHHRWTPGGYSTPVASRKSLSTSLLDSQDGVHQLNMESLKLNSSLLNSSALPSVLGSSTNSNILSSSLLNASILDSTILAPKTSVPSYLNQNTIPSSSKLSASSAMGYQSSTDLPDIPSSYLDQSEVLKYLLRREGKGSSDQSASSSNSGINLMSERSATTRDLSQMPLYPDLDTTASYDLINLPPPPSYPLWLLKDSEKQEDRPGEVGNHTREKSSLSKSQPDLTKLNNAKEASSPKELLSQRVVSGQQDSGEGTMDEVADILAQENSALKMEVDLYHRKVAKLQKFELEMVKVHEAHEALIRSSERREQLERLARHKLHAEVKRLSEINAELREQLSSSSRPLSNTQGGEAEALRKELNKRDVFIAQLISQNKELSAAKERQGIELTAQRQTLNEQRTHIDILDSALTNAQANVVKLEEELRKKQNLVEQAGQLKRVLVSLQLAGDKREQSERSLRHKLEKEIQHLRMGSREDALESKLSDLRREIREKEERIMILEGEVTKWEQRFLQESAMRQLAIEATSLPKDAKLSAIEKTSQENERSFSQLKAEKLRQMDELHSMNKKQLDFEVRNRELESHIAERDAMIRVLQRRVEEKEALYQKALMRNTLAAAKSHDGRSSSNTSVGHSSQHSSQASTIHSHSGSGTGTVSGVGAGSCAPPTPRRDEELVYLGQDIHTSSASAQHRELSGDQRRERSSEHGRRVATGTSSLDSPVSDDLLVDNEDRILGKLRVMCFPGLVNPSPAAGEGPVSQPLLAGIEQPTASSPTPLHPASDMSLLTHTSHLGSPQHIDLPTVTCSSHDASSSSSSPYGAPPSYPSDLHCAPPPPPPPRDQSSVSGGQSQSPNTRQGGNHPRGAPPPYYGHHELVTQQPVPVPPPSSPYPTDQVTPMMAPENPPSNFTRRLTPSTPNLSMDAPLPRPSMCRNPHHPTVACRKCNSVRSSNRHNAAILVRRANSTAGHGYRKSAPPPCQAEAETDDTPSILARLRQEWEMGNIPSMQTPRLDKKGTSRGKQEQVDIQLSNISNGNKSNCQQNELHSQKESESNKNEQIQDNIGSNSNINQESHKNNPSNEKVPESSCSDANANFESGSINANDKSLFTLHSAHPVTTSKQSLSSRVKHLFSNPLQLPDVSHSRTISITTANVNESNVDSVNNKTICHDHISKKNDLNQLNNNQEGKVELIILEDSDQLKTPKDITKPLKDVI